MLKNEADRWSLGAGVYHPGARPLKVVKDDKGDLWICDKNVDPRETWLPRVAGGAERSLSQETTEPESPFHLPREPKAARSFSPSIVFLGNGLSRAKR